MSIKTTAMYLTVRAALCGRALADIKVMVGSLFARAVYGVLPVQKRHLNLSPGSRRLAAGVLLFVITTGGVNAQIQLNVQPGVQLSWLENTNDTYNLQWSPIPATIWTELMAATGNGQTNTYFDPFPMGTRTYQVLDMVPAIPASSAEPTNGGFESGTGGSATDWTVDTAAGGPVYGVRTNDNPHSGSYNFEVYLASTGAGPVVEFNQSGVPVTGGTTYPFTFFADALSGSAGYNAQWRILWNTGGDTGYQTYTPGSSAYAEISNSVTAPAAATSATLYFHFAGAASSSQSATIDIDDVALGSASSSSPGTPAVTNVLPVAIQPVASVSWPTTLGTQYQPESTTNLAAGTWSTNFPIVTGDGGTDSFMIPMTNSAAFFRLQIPRVVVLPPSNLEQIVSGTTNAIGLAWMASSSPGVTGYSILYGVTGSGVTNTLNVGNVNSTVIPDLTPGQTYFLEIITLTASGQNSLASAAITGQPDTTDGVVPLYDASTVLEPDTISNTSNGLITWIADRPRARHARESQFMLYDTYLPFYWEERMTTIQIVDTFTAGGTNVTFNMWALTALDTPNIRFFFQGETTVAQYSDNLFANSVDPTLTNWTTTINYNTTFNRPIQAGDRIEFEFSPFMVAPTNGQANYYGGAILYIVGQGIVPWQEGATNDPGSVNAAIDSTPMPTNGYLAGADTMPYQYSDESNHVFNQLAPNASPLSGEPFVLGRRLNETDFIDGTHAEAGNPVYTEQIGKIGPTYVNVSCVACHVNNGRALPPAIGALMLQSAVHVGSDASGDPDPVLGSFLQPQSTNGTPVDTMTISSYTTINGQFADGTPYTLQKPNYTFGSYTPAFYSVRVAPQLVGIGLLEAVSEDSITALAAVDATYTNGVAGRIQTVTDPQTGQPRLGRFGYKAGRCRISQQIAGALDFDMGVTTSIFPVRNNQTNSGPVELADSDLTNWVRYISSLGVNARRCLTNPECLQGEQLFASANCVQCHIPTLTTSPYHPIAELRNQTIHPYTDLLLHDMGPGLADNMGEGNATGSQWRTAPLWSIGLTAGVSGGEAYLHDGRARSLTEAILWHGGEATASQQAFLNMSASDRAALIAFLQSL
ncbi:MAG: di-heme oxidoredictase family protein [Verrucomicrobiota bacterium]